MGMITRCLAAGAALASVFAAGASAGAAEPLVLENDFWEVTVHPELGARASRLYSRAHDYDFVVNWSPAEDGSAAAGGCFAGTMAGSFVSFRDAGGQMSLPYTVLEHERDRVRMRWAAPAALFTGLEEERTITLADDRPAVNLSLTVTNRSEESRVIAYRFQDWLGTGRNLGYESVYLVPQSDGSVLAYLYESGVPTATHRCTAPARPWYALADLPRDTGLLVSVSGAKIGGFTQWFSARMDPARRTAEIFFPLTRLEPGETWRAEISFTAFRPSDPGPVDPEAAPFLGREAIERRLAGAAAERVRSGPPLEASMRVLPGEGALRVVPVHPTDALLGTGLAQDYGGTLESIRLYGTPGEEVPFAFSAAAARPVEEARLSFGGLIPAGRFRRRGIGRENIGAWFASHDGYGYLVRDWALARDLPEEVGGINNSLVDASELTAFSLDAGERADIWALLRIPENAAAGDYRGEAVISTGAGEETAFTVKLTVYPFTLQKPTDKLYGTSFRYYLRRGEEDDRPHAVEKPVLREALADITRLGHRIIFLYGNLEQSLWMIDRCADLGWRDAVFIPMSATWRATSPEELRARHPDRNFRFYAWAVDEPRFKHRGDIERVLARHRESTARGFQPYYSCNSPFALIFAELLPELVPQKVMNSPFFIDVTRDYAARGRDIFWYSAELSIAGNTHRKIERLRRGVYFWKEPATGCKDWGDDSIHQRKSLTNTVGFAGTTVLHRTGRENVRQGLTDMYYLYTLERAAQASADPAVRGEAERFLARVRAHFDNDPSWHARQMDDLSWLDRLRRETAELIARTSRRR